MARIPGYIPGEKAHEWAGVLGAKKGAVAYVPVSPTPAKKEEVKKETPAKKVKE